MATTTTPNVIVYSTPTCPWCVKVKDFLKANNVKFEEYNVREDKKKALEMIEKSGQMGVPVVEIGDDIIVGFDRKVMCQLLGIPQ